MVSGMVNRFDARINFLSLPPLWGESCVCVEEDKRQSQVSILPSTPTLFVTGSLLFSALRTQTSWPSGFCECSCPHFPVPHRSTWVTGTSAFSCVHSWLFHEFQRFKLLFSSVQGKQALLPTELSHQDHHCFYFLYGKFILLLCWNCSLVPRVFCWCIQSFMYRMMSSANG